MAELKIYRCNHCGNIVIKVHDGGPTPVCCGEPMEELKANTTEAATEKHVPVITKEHDGHVVKVTVGSVEHPMTEEHSIQWIALVTPSRTEVHYLKPGEKPETVFSAIGLTEGTVFEYCNLHGLWSAAV